MVPLGFMELAFFPGIISLDTFSIGWRDIMGFIVAVNALTGHVLLIISLRKTKLKAKRNLILISEILFISSIILVAYTNMPHNPRLILYSSIPSLINMTILSILIFRKMRETETMVNSIFRGKTAKKSKSKNFLTE